MTHSGQPENPLRWNEDKKHRCPRCHAVAVDTERPRSWRVYTCCRCAARFTRWPVLARFLRQAGTCCSAHARLAAGGVLTWYPGTSADDDHDDVETDLAAIGGPGGAVWASVADEETWWSWAVYDRWLWDDIDADPGTHTLAEGTAASREEGMQAVSDWVHAQGGTR